MRIAESTMQPSRKAFRASSACDYSCKASTSPPAALGKQAACSKKGPAEAKPRRWENDPTAREASKTATGAFR